MRDALGRTFVFVPVFCGTIILVCSAMLWHRLSGRTYPFRQPHASGPHSTADKPAEQRLGLEPKELARILTDCRQSTNLGVEDLSRLIAAAERVAAGHVLGATTCAEIMLRDLVTVPPTARAAQIADLFRKHGFTSIPVVGEGGLLLGVIFQLDLIRRARRDAMLWGASFGRAMATLRRDQTAGIVRADSLGSGLVLGS